MNNTDSEIRRLDFENIINGIFICISLINVFGNEFQKKYLLDGNILYKEYANNLYVLGLIISFFLYIYFFNRNYSMYNNKDNPTDSDLIKVMGSFLYIVGVLCLLYFQINSEDNFIIGEPV